MYRAKTNIWDIDYSDNFERICDYVQKKKEKINQIKICYDQIRNIFSKFIEVTDCYSKQLSSIALELKPNSETIEGEFIQSIQNILLFNSKTLETLVSHIKEIIKNFKESKEMNLPALKDFSIMFKTDFSKVINLYCLYINENESYEKYLIHKELGILDSNNDIENNNNKPIIGKKGIEFEILEYENFKEEYEINKIKQSIKLKHSLNL